MLMAVYAIRYVRAYVSTYFIVFIRPMKADPRIVCREMVRLQNDFSRLKRCSGCTAWKLYLSMCIVCQTNN